MRVWIKVSRFYLFSPTLVPDPFSLSLSPLYSIQACTTVGVLIPPPILYRKIEILDEKLERGEGDRRRVLWEWVKIGLVSCTACAGVTTANKEGEGDLKKGGWAGGRELKKKRKSHVTASVRAHPPSGP